MFEYQNKLDENFLRVQRSYIINLKKIDYIDQDYINIGKQKIPIGGNYREELINKLNIG
jgi:DNA-binding LytR/AlgR family response regulator